MKDKLTVFALGMLLPAAALAEPVALRSTDGFITVEGEVTGFNGVMLTVQTTVGPVSVPASEVACFGAYCTELFSNNDFGLSESDVQGVFAGEEGTSLAMASVTGQMDDLTVTFAGPDSADLYDSLAAAFAGSDATSVITDLSSTGVVRLQDDSTAIALTAGAEDTGGDLQIATVSMNGAADLQYPTSSGWALTQQPTHQLLGLKAFAVIVPGNVTVDSITAEDLAGIYAGEITNWSELGGQDTQILPLQLPAGASTRQDLIRTVMEPLGKTIADNILTMADERSISASVNQFPGSISVIDFDSLSDNTILPVSGACGVGVAPTPFNIASGDYPLLRPVMASHGQQTNAPPVRAFFDFAASGAVQDRIGQAGYISQRAMLQPELDKNTRLNTLLNADLGDEERLAAVQMFQDLFPPADRLSPTFQGGPTSGPEGAWNRAMFRHLKELLETESYAGKEVIFVGFATSANGPEAAISISREAAEAVRSAFTEYAPETVLNNGLQLTTRGFGGVAPATCYAGQVSINAYSRVEVWVR